MIECEGLGGNRKLLIERYSEFMEVLKREGTNVAYVGIETRDGITYFRVILKN